MVTFAYNVNIFEVLHNRLLCCLSNPFADVCFTVFQGVFQLLQFTQQIICAPWNVEYVHIIMFSQYVGCITYICTTVGEQAYQGCGSQFICDTASPLKKLLTRDDHAMRAFLGSYIRTSKAILWFTLIECVGCACTFEGCAVTTYVPLYNCTLLWFYNTLDSYCIRASIWSHQCNNCFVYFLINHGKKYKQLTTIVICADFSKSNMAAQIHQS